MNQNQMPALLRTAFALVVGATFAASFRAHAQGSNVFDTFTYQGRLDDLGPGIADDPRIMDFLIKAVSPPVPCFGTDCGWFTNCDGCVTTVLGTNSVIVKQGMFTTPINMPTGLLSSVNGLYLQFAVRTNGGGEFTTLWPAQRLTATPFATVAQSVSGPVDASSLTGQMPTGMLAGIFSSPLSLSNPGNVIAGDGSLLANVNATTIGGTNPCDLTCYWRLTGNGGTDPNVNFLGTTDDAELVLRAHSQIVMRYYPHPTKPDGANLIGGAYVNTFSGGWGSVICGGGGVADNNTVLANVVGNDHSAIVGGLANRIYGRECFIGGGWGNTNGNINSHYVVISGGSNNFANMDFGFIGGGVNNSALDLSTVVAGGEGNTAAALQSTVGGGWHNVASGWASAVAGGYINTAAGQSSFVGGGFQNVVSNLWATIAGGTFNTVLADQATIGGGAYNLAAGQDATVSGGSGNAATNSQATVGGGINNIAGARYSTVGGGTGNQATGQDAVVSGGSGNAATSGQATVGGGIQNKAIGQSSTVSGGSSNAATNNQTTVGGGIGNIAGAPFSTVGGGNGNHATGQDAVVSGGSGNAATNGQATVGGGIGNNARGSGSTIGGGFTNLAGTLFSTVGGGGGNRATGTDATVAGGWVNAATNRESTVGGGIGNLAGGPFSTVGGGNGNQAIGQDAVVSGGSGNKALGGQTTVSGGIANTASGTASTVVGGQQNSATNDFSVASGRGGITRLPLAQAAGAMFATPGDAQGAQYILTGLTTNLTTFNLLGPAIPVSGAIAFSAMVSAKAFGNFSGGFEVKGVISNYGGSVGFIGTPSVTILGQDSASLNVTPLIASSRLVLQVTGISGLSVRWVATLRTSEVVF